MFNGSEFYLSFSFTTQLKTSNDLYLHYTSFLQHTKVESSDNKESDLVILNEGQKSLGQERGLALKTMPAFFVYDTDTLLAVELKRVFSTAVSTSTAAAPPGRMTLRADDEVNHVSV